MNYDTAGREVERAANQERHMSMGDGEIWRKMASGTTTGIRHHGFTAVRSDCRHESISGSLQKSDISQLPRECTHSQ